MSEKYEGSSNLWNDENGDWNDSFLPYSFEEMSDLSDHKISWKVNQADINLGVRLLAENLNINLIVFESAEISIGKNNKYLDGICDTRLEIERLPNEGQVSKFITFCFEGGNRNAFCIG